MAKTEKIKMAWKRDYGDGELTDDAVLWINGKPTDLVISGGEEGWFGVLYWGNKKLATADTRKELKTLLKTQFKKYLDHEIELYK